MTGKLERPEQHRQQAEAAPRFRAAESIPPWLVSTIVHLLVVILLAVIYLDQPESRGLGILLSTQEVGTEEEFDLFKLGGMDSSTSDAVTIEAQVVETPVAEIEPTELDIADLLSSVPSETDSLADMAAASGAGDGTSGSGQGETNFYGLGGSGKRFVYVFDRSASMTVSIPRYSEGYIVGKITPLLSAKEELWKSIQSLSEDLAFQIIFYNHFPVVFGSNGSTPQLFQAVEENKSAAKAFIDGVEGDGTTDHILALKEALQLNPDVIFLLTDGEYKDDPKLRDVRRMASLCNRKHVVIHVIHLVPKPRPGTTLIELAKRTGGQHLFIEL